MPVIFRRAKSDRLNLRIAPRAKFGLELLAKKERKTPSAIFEEALTRLFEERLREERRVPGEQGTVQVSLLDETWDALAPDRLVKLARLAPEYLDDKERAIWTVIRERADCWRDKETESPNMPAIREAWSSIEAEADRYLEQFGPNA